MTGAPIRVGTVKTVHPARREAVIAPEPGAQREFADRQWLWFAAGEQTPRRFKIESVHTDDNAVRIRFAPGLPRDDVAAFQGAAVFIPEDERRGPSPDDYGLDDLVGMTVLDAAGERLGDIRDFYSAGGNDVAEVETPDGARFLFPLVPEAVTAIDFDAGAVTVGDLTPFRVDHAD